MRLKEVSSISVRLPGEINKYNNIYFAEQYKFISHFQTKVYVCVHVYVVSNLIRVEQQLQA